MSRLSWKKWINIKEAKPVMVLWEDACNGPLGWYSFDHLKENHEDPWLNISIGFLMINKPNYIVLVGGVGNGNYELSQKIPRAYIKSIHKLK